LFQRKRKSLVPLCEQVEISVRLLDWTFSGIFFHNCMQLRTERKENEAATHPSPAKPVEFEPYVLESPISPRRQQTPLPHRLQKDLFQLDVSNATLALWDQVMASSEVSELASPSSLSSPHAVHTVPLEPIRSPQPPPRRDSGGSLDVSYGVFSSKITPDGFSHRPRAAHAIP
jgi:hypothetical protein